MQRCGGCGARVSEGKAYITKNPMTMCSVRHRARTYVLPFFPAFLAMQYDCERLKGGVEAVQTNEHGFCAVNLARIEAF